MSALPAWMQVVGARMVSPPMASPPGPPARAKAGRDKASATQEATVAAATMTGRDHEYRVLEAIKRIGHGLDVSSRFLDGLSEEQGRTTAAVDRLTAAVDRQERATRDLHGELSAR